MHKSLRPGDRRSTRRDLCYTLELDRIFERFRVDVTALARVEEVSIRMHYQRQDSLIQLCLRGTSNLKNLACVEY
jgi:hypothetical protein